MTNQNETQPGIIGLMTKYQRTTPALNALAEVLLRPADESQLTRGERELAFTIACWMNDCKFCAGVHGACAAKQLPNGPDLIQSFRAGGLRTVINPEVDVRYRTIMLIAASVAMDTGRQLRQSMQANAGIPGIEGSLIDNAKANGFSDEAIHDIALIAASACMFNRYVDALSPEAPDDKDFYNGVAEMLVSQGYLNAIPTNG